MMNLKTILGISCIACGVGYLYYSKKDGDGGIDNLKGLDINVNPDVLVDSAVRLTNRIPEQYKDGVSHYSKKLVSGLMGRKL